MLEQTYKNFELIMVVDCPKDNTLKIIDEFCQKDDRIKKYCNEKNSGVSYSRNFGVSVAKGEWIAFLDHDDIWEKDKLQEQINLLIEKNKEPILIYTGSAFIDEENVVYDTIFEVPEKVGYKELLKQNVISCSSVLVKKEVLNSIKMEKDEVHEDFLLWLRILKKYNMCAYGINKPLLIYRLSRNSKSGNKLKSAQMTYSVYKHIGLNFFERIYYMFQYTIRSLIKYRKLKRV